MVAGGGLFACGIYEAGAADRGNDQAGAAAGPVLEVHRLGGGAGRNRADTSRAFAHSNDANSAGCGGTRHHHDRCDGDRVENQYGALGAVAAGDWVACGAGGLRAVEAGADSRKVPRQVF